MPANPSCRTDVLYPINDPAPAACLIKLQGKLVALETQNNALWLLPQQRKQANLSAQCTAHQAAWKDTGLNVEVAQLLYVDENDKHFYHCALTDGFSQALDRLEVPSWATRKVTKVALVDPFATETNQWARSENLIEIRQAFTQIAANIQ